MDDAAQAKAHKEGLEEEVKTYAKLKRLNQSQELSDFLDLLVKTSAQKMIWAFIGDNVKTWDDFLKVRGEVVAYMYPIQEIRGADAMEKHLKGQLDSFYKQS